MTKPHPSYASLRKAIGAQLDELAHAIYGCSDLYAIHIERYFGTTGHHCGTARGNALFRLVVRAWNEWVVEKADSEHFKVQMDDDGRFAVHLKREGHIYCIRHGSSDDEAVPRKIEPVRYEQMSLEFAEGTSEGAVAQSMPLHDLRMTYVPYIGADGSTDIDVLLMLWNDRQQVWNEPIVLSRRATRIIEVAPPAESIWDDLPHLDEKLKRDTKRDKDGTSNQPRP